MLLYYYHYYCVIYKKKFIHSPSSENSIFYLRTDIIPSNIIPFWSIVFADTQNNNKTSIHLWVLFINCLFCVIYFNLWAYVNLSMWKKSHKLIRTLEIETLNSAQTFPQSNKKFSLGVRSHSFVVFSPWPVSGRL